MATSITTQEDVFDVAMISDNELSRLETERMKSDNWAKVHILAWTLVKKYLSARDVPLEETDLKHPDELKPATCFAVIYLAYQAAEILPDESLARKKYWFRRMRKELAMVDITHISGAVLPRESYSSRRALRA